MIGIREMQIDDLDQVMEIERENFSVPWTENGFFTFLFRQDALFLVAVENEEILGYIGILMVPDDGDITNVAVKKSRQGEGIGKLLIEGMIEASGKQGVRNIFLEVRKSNAPAIHLYEKYGFVTEGVRKNYYDLPKEDALVMKRTDIER